MIFAQGNLLDLYLPLVLVLKVKVKLLSRVRLFVTPWTVAYQAPLSMGFSRQEYSSVHGIFQARVLEWIAISFSRGSSQPKD